MRHVFCAVLLGTVLLSAVPHTNAQSPHAPVQGAKTEGNLYTNLYLGFSFRFPQGWAVREIDEEGSHQGNVLDVGPRNLPDRGMVVFYHDLAPLIQTESDFLVRFKDSLASKKFEITQPPRPVTYGNQQFYRLDTRMQVKVGWHHQSTVVIILGRNTPNRRLIGFGATGLSETEVNDVLVSLATFQSSEGKDTTASNPHPRRIRVSQGVGQSYLIDKVTPYYPEDAKMARIQGAVVLRVLIGKDGKVMKVDVVSGHPMLVPAARDAVLRWRYRPYVLNGEVVEVETQVTVAFTMIR